MRDEENALLLDMERVMLDACHTIDEHDSEKATEIFKRTMKIMDKFGKINKGGGQE